MKAQESRRRLDPPSSSFRHLSSHHSLLSIPLMSVLSISSQCELVDIMYTHRSYIILRTYCYIFYHSVSVCITNWFGMRPVVLSKALKLLVFTMWWQRKVLFEMKETLIIFGVSYYYPNKLYSVYPYRSYLLSPWFIRNIYRCFADVHYICRYYFLFSCQASQHRVWRENIHENVSNWISLSCFSYILHFMGGERNAQC